MKEFGGKEGTNVASPCINCIDLDDQSDFILLGCKIYIFLFFR
jgi:hypothetical protein